MFSKDQITDFLTCPLPEIELHESIDSTNLRCKILAEADAPEGTLVLAGHQTAGRGRLGRTFFSPADTGLYMSLLLRPSIPPEEALSITACAAVCVSEAIEAISGRRTGIKWVNDIYLDGRKVCGILTEAAFTPSGDTLRYAVLGIGVNVAPPEGDFPSELTGIAASVFGEPGEDMRPRLAAEITNRFFRYYPRLMEKEYWQGYRDRLFLRGQPVQILWGSGKGCGICMDVDRDFRLLVQREDGTLQAVSTGEVSVRPV